MNNLKTVELPECYRVLKIPPGSGWSTIKGAYHARAMEYHPDRNYGDPECEEQFKKVVHAFQVLSELYEQGDNYYSFSKEYENPSGASCKEGAFENSENAPPAAGESGFRFHFAQWSNQIWERLKSLERSLLVLDVETVISLDRETAFNGGTVKIRRGTDYTEVRVPRGVDDKSVITIEGGGDRGILNTRRGDLRIRFQFKSGSAPNTEFHHVVEVAQSDIARRKMFTLDTPDGPIRYSLPTNSRDGQQFTLYSAKLPGTGQRKRHVISIRVQRGI